MTPEFFAALAAGSAASAAAGDDPASAAASAAEFAAISAVLNAGRPTRPLSPLDVLTLRQAADYLQLSLRVVRAEAVAGRLVGRPVGKSWRFSRHALFDWLNRPQPPAYVPPVWDAEAERECEAFLADLKKLRARDEAEMKVAREAS